MDSVPQRQFQDWASVQQALAQLVEVSLGLFAPPVIANAQQLITACHVRCAMPSGIGKGYWNTISIRWQNLFEVEVFGDRYELYRFSQGRTEIQYFDHIPGTEVPFNFVSQLAESTTGE